MIAVSCSACHLRFEASAAERRIHGPGITCPACAKGEPIVLDAVDLQETERGGNGRLRLDPPPLDPTAAADERLNPVNRAVARAAERRARKAPRTDTAPEPTLDELRGPLPENLPPLPVYVDFDEPDATVVRGTPLWATAMGSGAAVMLLFFLAVTMTWQSGTSPIEGAGTFVASVLGPETKTDDRLVTASIAPVARKLAIARVATELAETDEGRRLSVRTAIRNEGDRPARVPPLRIAIRSLDGTVLHRWTDEGEGDWIDPGETRAVTATTARIPDGAGDVKVDFANQ